MHTLAAATALALAAATLVGCASSNAFTPTNVPRYTPEQFYRTTSVAGASFDADAQQILVSSDQTGVFNAYVIDIDSGAKTQLTESDTDAIFAQSFFPNDDRIVYTADTGGNERFRVFIRETNGNTAALTPEGARALFAGFSHDGKHFYVMSNERNPQQMDLYRHNASTYERELVYQPPQGFSVASISRNERYLALNKVRNNMDSDVFLIDLNQQDPQPKLVTPHEGNINHAAAGFTPDSDKLLILSNRDSEWDRLWAYDLDSGEMSVMLEADWDIMYVSYSHDGRYRTHAVNADAQTVITVTDTTTGREVNLPELPAGSITGVSFPRSDADSSRMAFYASSDTSPPNLFVLDLENTDTAPARLTDTLNPAINEDHLVDADIIRYESFDGLEIPSVLYRPRNATAENPVPALVWVHGGPGGQTRKGYSALMQLFANHGYAVLGVNNRGSSGYGKTFFHMDDRDHGGGDLQDCIQGRAYLESLDWIQPDRIGIIGGSYGGYMVCAALAFEPDSFDVGINIFGVTNWIRTLESIPAWWADFREALYAEIGDPNDPDDRQRLEARSPLLHAENITKPLLVIQGANDPRVIKAESDDIVERVRANGVPVHYVVFDDEGHGFRNRENRITAAKAYLEFLETYLTRNAASPRTMAN